MEPDIFDTPAEAGYAELVAECVQGIEQRRVAPLARTIAATVRLCALRDAETSRHTAFACWADDVAVVAGQFAEPGMVDRVAEAATDRPGHCLAALETSCLALIDAREALLPVHGVWLRLNGLQDRRPMFELWQARAQQALVAHGEASATAEPERSRRFRDATDLTRQLIGLHPVVVEAHDAWTALSERQGEGDMAHPLFASWRQVVAGFSNRSGGPDVIRIAAHGGWAPSVADLERAYRGALEVLKRLLAEHAALRNQLAQRRTELASWTSKVIGELGGMTQQVRAGRDAVAQAAGRTRTSVSFNGDHYGSAFSAGGGIGLVLGFGSCMSNGFAVGNFVAGGLIGALVGPVLVGAAHLVAASSHSEQMGQGHRAAREALGGACEQARAALGRAASLRKEVVGALVQPTALDAAAVELRLLVEAAQHEV